MVQNSVSLTLLVSPAGEIESTSAAVTRRLGHDPELLEGRPMAELVLEADRPVLAGALDRAAHGATAAFPVTAQVSLLREGGRGSVPYELAIVNLVDDPTVAGYVVTGHDTSPRALAEFELRKAQSLLTATLDATADGILVVDSAGRLASFNRNFVEMWRLPDSIAVGRDDARAIAFVREQLVDPDAFVARIDELYNQPDAESLDVLEFLDGRVFERFSTPQRLGNRTVGRVWSFRDLTDRKRLEERMTYQLVHDALTGLGNRVLFLDRLQHASARLERTGGRLAVLVVDVDEMTAINDSMGNAAGDRVLRSTAERLLGCLRSADTAARLGGDEYGILVEDVADAGEVLGLAERILAELRHPIRVGDNEISVTASIGVAIDHLGRAGDQVLSRADLASSTAKLDGGDRVALFGADTSCPLLSGVRSSQPPLPGRRTEPLSQGQLPRDERGRQDSLAHQVAVHRGGGRAPLGDRPHDEALAAGHVPADEHSLDVGRPAGVGGHTAPGVELQPEVGDHAVPLGTEEAHGQQHELTGEFELAPLDRNECRPSVVTHDRLDLVAAQRADPARRRPRATRRWSPRRPAPLPPPARQRYGG